MSFELLSESGEYERLRLEVRGGESLRSDQVRRLTVLAEEEFYRGYICGGLTFDPINYRRREKGREEYHRLRDQVFRKFVAESAFGFLAMFFLRTIILSLIDAIWKYYFLEDENYLGLTAAMSSREYRGIVESNQKKGTE